MCGIIGVKIFKGESSEHRKFIRWATNSMMRRGPDTEGYLEEKRAIFGFRRLAIRDLSPAANQPMRDPSGQFILVFNGEIYNTKFLQKQLGSHVLFSTHSDTEVLLQCLLNWGIEKTLTKLDGIFAFSWYDSKKDVLILARDRCGVKPLYYAVNENVLLFGSEYSPLLCHNQFHASGINPDALANYLRLGFIPDGEALYRGSFLLPHGHYLVAHPNGQVELNEYYDFPFLKSPYAQVYDRDQSLLHAVKESIQGQMVSDVPLGVFQSGGIDSSIISSLATKSNPELDAFTIGVHGNGDMDESITAQAMTETLNVKHYLKTISDSQVYASLIDQHIEAFSEPFADYSSLPTLLLAQFCKNRITVALSGDGGDELFWGYPRNYQAAKAAPLFLMSKFKRTASVLWKKAFGGDAKIPLNVLKYSYFSHFAFEKTFIAGAKNWADRINPHRPIAPFFLKKINKNVDKNNFLDTPSLMNILRKIEFDFHLQRVLLKVDRASMYHSLEVRVPLLGNAVLEAASNYLYSECIRSDQGKIPLRRLLATINPRLSLINLPKKGFTVPINDWINGLLSLKMQNRILEVPSEFSNFFDKRQLELLWQSRISEHNGWLIWAIFVLFEWYDQNLKKLRKDFQLYSHAFHRNSC